MNIIELNNNEINYIAGGYLLSSIMIVSAIAGLEYVCNKRSVKLKNKLTFEIGAAFLIQSFANMLPLAITLPINVALVIAGYGVYRYQKYKNKQK